MQPIFTMQYGEFAVVNYLSNSSLFKGTSVFIPTSAQEKGIDLLLYRYDNGRNTTITIQVKMSRAYYPEGKRKSPKYPYYLWFNRFEIQENADWYVLVGIYAKFPVDPNSRADTTKWGTIMLAFTRKEMTDFMSNVKQKLNREKDDKMFGFGFEDGGSIFQTRGCPKDRDMTEYLIEKRLVDIRNSFR